MTRARSSTLALLALGAVLGASGCGRRGDPGAGHGRPCEEVSGTPVDAALLAWLSKARTLHHLADRAEADGAVERAIAPLVELTRGALPAGPPPETREVLADTYARLAELRARQSDFERAEQDLAAGLALAPEATYFRGHLLEVRGLVDEKLSRHLEEEGRGAEAKKARERAMQASLEAVRVQDDVIKRALGDAGAGQKRD